MKVAIVGSRNFKNLSGIKSFIESLDKDTVIISGGAVGVDRCAEKTAKELGMKTIIFNADWSKYGKRAGFLRNKDIVAASDYVVCFWDGSSKGTAHDIELAKEMGKKLIVIGD